MDASVAFRVRILAGLGFPAVFNCVLGMLETFEIYSKALATSQISQRASILDPM